MTVVTRALGDSDRAAYRSLLDASEDALIYATPEYRDLLSACVPGNSHYLGAWSQGALVGVMPVFATEQTPLGRVVNSLPWYGSHGGCIVDPAHAGAARKALLSAFGDLCAEEPLLSATVVMPLFDDALLQAYSDRLSPRVTDDRIGQVTDLPKAGPGAHDDLMSRFRYPGQVRKSLRQGFCLKRTDQDWAWRFLHQVHDENMRAVGGKAKPWSHFQALRDHLPAPWRAVSVAMLDGRPGGGPFAPLFQPHGGVFFSRHPPGAQAAANRFPS